MKNEGPGSVEGEAEVPTPRVFFVRVANKGVRVDAASINVTPLEAEGLKTRVDGKRSGKDNAETQKRSGAETAGPSESVSALDSCGIIPR
jgi:hypothetical protein